MSRKLDLAWAAGLIDGDGCVHIQKCNIRHKTTQYSLVVSVRMTDGKTIKKLKSIFKRGYLGTRLKLTKGGRKLWQWQCVCDEAYQILKLVRPFLVTKKKEAVLGIKFQERCMKRGICGKRISFKMLYIRDRYYHKMRDLKKPL